MGAVRRGSKLPAMVLLWLAPQVMCFSPQSLMLMVLQSWRLNPVMVFFRKDLWEVIRLHWVDTGEPHDWILLALLGQKHTHTLPVSGYVILCATSGPCQ